MTSTHALIHRAIAQAASLIEAQTSAGGSETVREKHFRQALRDSLEAAGEVCAHEVRPELPGWPNVGGGKLGGFDLAVVGDGGPPYRLLAELKWCYIDKLWETLWDVFKVSLAIGIEGTEGAYVVAGAPTTLWGKSADCVELFADGVWSARELISHYSTNWSWLLGEGSKSQPVRLPALIQTELVANEPLHLADSAWAIKAITAMPASDEWIELENGWPTEHRADVSSLPPEQAETVRNLKNSIKAPVPENVIAWRYFNSPTLHQQAERLSGVEIRDLGFIDLTIIESVAREHLPTTHPVLAAVFLREGTLIAPMWLLNENSQDADLLLAPGTRFRVSQIGWEGDLLTLGLEIVG
jgi:hypothetical protein